MSGEDIDEDEVVDDLPGPPEEPIEPPQPSAKIPTEEKEAPGGIPQEGLEEPPKVSGRTCKYCGKVFYDPLALGRHVAKEHKREKQLEREKESEGKGEISDEQIYAEIRIKGITALEEVMKKRLEQLLSMPGIPPESRRFVISEWDRDPTIRLDFRSLQATLYDAGIKPEKIQRIIDRLVQLYNKFAPATQDAGYYSIAPQQERYQRYPPSFGPPVLPQPPNSTVWAPSPPLPTTALPSQSFPQPQYSYFYPPPASQPLSEERIIRRIIEELPKVMPQQQQRQQDEMEADIVLTYTPEGEPVMGKIRGSQTAIMGLIMAAREQAGGKGKSPEVTALLEELEKKEKAFNAQMERLQDKLEAAEKRADETERQHLQEQIASLREDIRRTQETYQRMLKEKDNQLLGAMQRSSTEGYRSDSLRFVDSTVGRLERIIENRKPVDKLLDLLMSPVQPGQKTSDIEEFVQLKESGLLVEK